MFDIEPFYECTPDWAKDPQVPANNDANWKAAQIREAMNTQLGHSFICHSIQTGDEVSLSASTRSNLHAITVSD